MLVFPRGDEGYKIYVQIPYLVNKFTIIHGYENMDMHFKEQVFYNTFIFSFGLPM